MVEQQNKYHPLARERGPTSDVTLGMLLERTWRQPIHVRALRVRDIE